MLNEIIHIVYPKIKNVTIPIVDVSILINEPQTLLSIISACRIENKNEKTKYEKILIYGLLDIDKMKSFPNGEFLLHKDIVYLKFPASVNTISKKAKEVMNIETKKGQSFKLYLHNKLSVPNIIGFKHRIDNMVIAMNTSCSLAMKYIKDGDDRYKDLLSVFNIDNIHKIIKEHEVFRQTLENLKLVDRKRIISILNEVERAVNNIQMNSGSAKAILKNATECINRLKSVSDILERIREI